MSIGKNDQSAISHYGPKAYGEISKSAFAVLAWHLANLASASCDAPGAAEARMIEEAEALNGAGILPDAHLKAVRRALAERAADFTSDEDSE